MQKMLMVLVILMVMIGGVMAESAEEAYKKVVASAEKGDFGAIYDFMDKDTKQHVMKGIEILKKSLEKKKVDIKNISERDVYIMHAKLFPEFSVNYRAEERLLPNSGAKFTVKQNKDSDASLATLVKENGLDSAYIKEYVTLTMTDDQGKTLQIIMHFEDKVWKERGPFNSKVEYVPGEDDQGIMPCIPYIPEINK